VFEKGGWDFLRCGGCGLVSISPLPTLEEIERHHDESYSDGGYATFAAAATVRTAIASSRLDTIEPIAPDGPWLDVGCSTGAFVAEVAARGLDVEGLEISTVAVEHARARGFTVHQGAVEDFVPNRDYAVITAFDVVEHLRDPVDFIRRIQSWLRPGAILAVTVPNMDSFAARAMGRSWFYYAPPDHLHYFSPKTAERLFRSLALEDVSIRPAYKPLTLGYAAEQLAHFTPPLAPLARGLSRILPARLTDYPWPMPLGEIFVTARRASTDEASAHG